MSRSDRAFVDQGVIGKGGAATVRKVFDPRLLRETALKHVRADEVHPEVLSQFYEEARIAGQLEHPNMVQVYEVGPDSHGGLYVSMKLVDGETLGERVDALGPDRLSQDNLAELVGVLVRACDAIAHAHARGVIHCDLKPSNLLIGRFGAVYVADWGTAHLLPNSELTAWSGDTAPNQTSPGGTPAFLSPEQAVGDPAGVGTFTDVFGLGALLYYVLTGQPLYGEAPPAEAVFKAATGDYTPLSAHLEPNAAPRRLRRICETALSRHPEDRQPSVLALRHELEQFLRGTWNMPALTFPPGARIVTEGDGGDRAYVVQSGRLRVFTDHDGHVLQLRELGPGDVFGEMAALVGHGRRTASVEAITEVVVLEVSAEALEDGLGLNTWLGTFVTALADRFHELDTTLRNVRVSQIPEAKHPDGE